MDESKADGDLVLIQTFLLYYVNQVILMLTSIFQGHGNIISITKQRRFASKEGCSQPHMHLKAWDQVHACKMVYYLDREKKRNGKKEKGHLLNIT